MQLLKKLYNFHRLKYGFNYCTSKTSQQLEERRKQIMAKGLPKQKPIDGVKQIVLVSSGKGGVGKSTIAVNLAAALKIIEPNKEVGLLDADVFGPSVPLMMNLYDSPLLNNKNLMIPLTNYGVKCMSMGFLIDEGAPVIWRGLMVMQALNKLMRQVAWDCIDYLIIDTPPGTGDTHLSLVQNLPIAGVVVVTTPQLASIQVTKRGINMLQKLSIPIIGIVENMSFVKCPSCNNNIHLFNSETLTLSKETNAKILQQIPLKQEISISSEEGVPFVIENKNNLESNLYKNLAKQVVDFLNTGVTK